MATHAASPTATLVRNFLRQDMALKYRRSALGFVWSLLNPLLMLLVMTMAFSFLFERGENFSLHLFATLLPWQCLAACVGQGSRSLITSERFIRQVPVPVWVFPFRRSLFSLTEYLLSTLALTTIVWLVGFVPTVALLILPLSVLCLFAFGFGLAALSAVLVVFFRDAEHLVAVILRAWFYLSPILIPFTVIPEELEKWFKLNPTYYLLQMFDHPITLGLWPPTETIVASVGIASVTLLLGVFTLNRFKDDIVFRL